VGWIARVLGFERTGSVETVKVDPGGGANKTAEHYGPPGLDAPPLPGDSAACEDSTGTGSAQASGYSDGTTRVAQPGEFRTYARDEAGLVVGSIWQKRDGTIVANNANGMIELTPAGVLNILCPEVRLGDTAGQPVARQGDLVAVVTPLLLSAAPGSPVTPVPPTAVSPLTGGILCTGQIISGAVTVKAGP